MLIRKHDWHDREGIRLLLDHGADPNHRGRWGHSALHHGLLRNNDLKIIELLLDQGADPAVTGTGRSAVALDGKGRSPLALAVRACTDSNWADRRSPESVELQLRAVASASGCSVPTGYAAVDTLLRSHPY